MMTRWIKAACCIGMLIGVGVACGDSETTGTGGSPGTGASGGTPTTTSANGGSTANTGGMTGSGGSGDCVPSGEAVNGCTRNCAADRTGSAMASVAGWSIPHADCIVVDTGTTVTWSGDFGFHPLTGGETPGMEDATSPITGNTPAGMSVEVTFPDAGTYPYYCTNHGTQMQGVIYVE